MHARSTCHLIFDKDSRLVHVSNPDSQYLAVVPEEGLSAKDLFAEAAIPKLCADGALSVLSKTIDSFEADFPTANGKVAQLFASPLSSHQTLVSIFESASLQLTSERFALTFQNAPIGLALVSPHGKWLDVNQELCRITGYSKEELLELDFQSITHPEDLEKDFDLVTQVLRGDIETYRMDKRYFRKDKSVLFAQLDVSLVRNEDGEPVHFISQIQDISERVRSQEVLKKAAEDLEQKNTQLEEFNYMASHDLQEPLRKIISFSELLQEDLGDSLTEDVGHSIGVITSCTQRMRDLISDLLTLSRVGNRDLDSEEVSLNVQLKIVLEQLSELTAEKQVEVTICDLPTIKNADSLTVRQLFQNLIGNAVKYNQSTSPTVEITFEDNVIGVKDNGIGISLEHHEKVFQPFYRLHSKSNYPGSGVGLAICKRIVDRHGGRLWVESKEGEGSHFKFTLG